MRIWASMALVFAAFSPNLSLGAKLVYSEKAAISTPGPGEYTGAHTLEVRCSMGDDKIKISRMSILDIPKAKNTNLDFGITTGHGLLDDHRSILTDCRVHDFKGKSYDINNIHVAKNYGPGTANDWAIISFERAKKSQVIRYALANAISVNEFDELARSELQLSFASARGLADGNQRCIALPRQTVGMNTENYAGLLPHSCKAISGQSGAPLSVVRNNRNVLLGLHIGHAFWVGVPDQDKPARHGYMRILDDDLIAAINTNVTTLMEKE